ncbi:NAD(P)-dependent oxidoreductase [Micromonospora zhanjiangensis]
MYGCGQDEAALFRELAPRLGVRPTIIEDAALLALSQVGVEYISTRSIGYNHIDMAYAQSVGISVGNVAYSPDSVADYTLMLMLMAVRQMKATIRRTDAHDYRLSDARGKELRDLTVGVVGTGRIGSAVMDRLRGFGGPVLAYDTYHGTAARYVPLDELLLESDIVTLHTPLTEETYHLLSRQRIAQLPYGAFVVNTGRGALIDTEALVEALESGRLGGAALDVVEGEEGVFYTDCRDKPIASKALLRLQEMPNVLISPHMAYYTDHALRDTVENSLINCVNFERDKQYG